MILKLIIFATSYWYRTLLLNKTSIVKHDHLPIGQEMMHAIRQNQYGLTPFQSDNPIFCKAKHALQSRGAHEKKVLQLWRLRNV